MSILNFVKGILIGIAKIIPGVSGTLLMISFQLYDKAIYAITNFFKDVRGNFYFLLEIGLGVLVGVILFSNVILFCLDNYYLYTVMFFIGLICGGIPCLIKKISMDRSNLLFVAYSFCIVYLLSIFSGNYDYKLSGTIMDFFLFFFAGFLEAIGTVVPGVSSTALLMLVGVYSYYITSISHLFYISLFWDNMMFFVPFSLGLMFGIVVVSYVLEYLFRNFLDKTYSFILGCVLGSVVLLFVRVVPFISSWVLVFISCILFLVGYIIANLF